MGEIYDMRFEDLLIGKLHAKNLHKLGNIWQTYGVSKNRQFSGFKGHSYR